MARCACRGSSGSKCVARGVRCVPLSSLCPWLRNKLSGFGDAFKSRRRGLLSCPLGSVHGATCGGRACSRVCRGALGQRGTCSYLRGFVAQCGATLERCVLPTHSLAGAVWTRACGREDACLSRCAVQQRAVSWACCSLWCGSVAAALVMRAVRRRRAPHPVGCDPGAGCFSSVDARSLGVSRHGSFDVCLFGCGDGRRDSIVGCGTLSLYTPDDTL